MSLVGIEPLFGVLVIVGALAAPIMLLLAASDIRYVLALRYGQRQRAPPGPSCIDRHQQTNHLHVPPQQQHHHHNALNYAIK